MKNNKIIIFCISIILLINILVSCGNNESSSIKDNDVGEGVGYSGFIYMTLLNNENKLLYKEEMSSSKSKSNKSYNVYEYILGEKKTLKYGFDLSHSQNSLRENYLKKYNNIVNKYDLYTSTVIDYFNKEEINVIYSASNPFGMISGNFGDLDNQEKIKVNIQESVISNYNKIGDLFEKFMGCFKIPLNETVYHKEIDKNAYQYLSEINMLTSDLSSNIGVKGKIIGLNYPYYMDFENDSYEYNNYDELMEIVSNLFGYDSKNDFIKDARELSEIYENYRDKIINKTNDKSFLENGCFYTKNKIFIFPIVFYEIDNFTSTRYAFIAIDKENRVSLYLDGNNARMHNNVILFDKNMIYGDENNNYPKIPAYLYARTEKSEPIFICKDEDFITNKVKNIDFIIPSQLFNDEYGIINLYFTLQEDGKIDSSWYLKDCFNYYLCYHKNSNSVEITTSSSGLWACHQTSKVLINDFYNEYKGDYKRTTYFGSPYGLFYGEDDYLQLGHYVSLKQYDNKSEKVSDVIKWNTAFLLGKDGDCKYNSLDKIKIYFENNSKGFERKELLLSLNNYNQESYRAYSLIDYEGCVDKVIYKNSWINIQIPDEYFNVSNKEDLPKLCVYGIDENKEEILLSYTKFSHIHILEGQNIKQ